MWFAELCNVHAHYKRRSNLHSFMASSSAEQTSCSVAFWGKRCSFHLLLYESFILAILAWNPFVLCRPLCSGRVHVCCECDDTGLECRCSIVGDDHAASRSWNRCSCTCAQFMMYTLGIGAMKWKAINDNIGGCSCHSNWNCTLIDERVKAVRPVVNHSGAWSERGLARMHEKSSIKRVAKVVLCQHLLWVEVNTTGSYSWSANPQSLQMTENFGLSLFEIHRKIVAQWNLII